MTLTEAINRNLFRATLRRNGRSVTYVRGDQQKSLATFYLDGRTEADLSRNEVVLSVLRSFVIERKALSVFFPPQPNDMIMVKEAGGDRVFAIRSSSGTPFWSYWNSDSRYVKIETKEVRR